MRMHDTCNTANKTACLAKSLRDTSGQLFFGYDEWESKAEDDKPWFDYLCVNHTRNSPMEWWIQQGIRQWMNLLYSYWSDMRYAVSGIWRVFTQNIRWRNYGYDTWVCGTATRVDASGVLLLRSLCKLTHKGHKQYAKGDGHAFEDYLQNKWPGVKNKNRCIGRAEHSKRQDWICEASWKFHNLLTPIVAYTISTVRLGANILRDSILTRIENMHFEAYVHVHACAILWKTAFEELRIALPDQQKEHSRLRRRIKPICSYYSKIGYEVL
jgi:hypothetical protein